MKRYISDGYTQVIEPEKAHVRSVRFGKPFIFIKIPHRFGLYLQRYGIKVI